MMLLTDGREWLRQQLQQKAAEIEAARQHLEKLKLEHSDLKRRWETIDREWAFRDGRYRVVVDKRPKAQPMSKAEAIRLILSILEQKGVHLDLFA